MNRRNIFSQWPVKLQCCALDSTCLVICTYKGIAATRNIFNLWSPSQLTSPSHCSFRTNGTKYQLIARACLIGKLPSLGHIYHFLVVFFVPVSGSANFTFSIFPSRVLKLSHVKGISCKPNNCLSRTWWNFFSYVQNFQCLTVLYVSKHSMLQRMKQKNQ